VSSDAWNRHVAVHRDVPSWTASQPGAGRKYGVRPTSTLLSSRPTAAAGCRQGDGNDRDNHPLHRA
jgi:hypothetical protein